MNGYVMETRQVTKTYGSFLALDHVNIHVRKGCIYGLVGDNGAGKSTLLKLLAGPELSNRRRDRNTGKTWTKRPGKCPETDGLYDRTAGIFSQYDRGADFKILLYPERDTG